MIRSVLVTATLLASASVLAQPALAQSAPGGANSVTRASVQTSAETEFRRVDTDKDGQMSRAEIETFQTARLTETLNARTKEVFAELDADKNGQLSAAEFAKLNPPRKADATPVLRIDANKDGKISLAEHRGARLKTFDELDSNKDGTLTTAEVDAAAKKLGN